jgi:hypothetical protein
MHYAEAAETLAGLFPTTKARFRACYRKCAYANLGQALEVKERRERQTGVTLFVYPCEYVEEPNEHWHLSRQEPSPTQMEARVTRLCESIKNAGHELRRLESTIVTMRRQCAALKADIRRRTKRIEWARSITVLTALYAEQRHAVTRLVGLVDEELDLALAHNCLLCSLKSVNTRGVARTAESYQAYVSQLMTFEQETERVREENAAFLTESLAGLDEKERQDIAWIRQQINERYALPATPWRR